MNSQAFHKKTTEKQLSAVLAVQIQHTDSKTIGAFNHHLSLSSR
jgi:hypothetical protein